VMAVEIRCGDEGVAQAVGRLNDPSAAEAVTAERALLAALGGGCRVPVGAWARHDHGALVLDGMVTSPDASRSIRAQAEAAAGEGAASVAARVATKLEQKGASGILAALG
jgi:hydroxymethylbilane synthase